MADVKLIVEGSSINAGAGNDPTAMWQPYPAMASRETDFINVSQGGGNINHYERRAERVARLADPGKVNILVIDCFVNGGLEQGVGPYADEVERYKQLFRYYRDAGLYVVPQTMLYRKDDGFNQANDVANSLLRSWVGVHCDELIDFQADATMQAIEDSYWGDQVLFDTYYSNPLDTLHPMPQLNALCRTIGKPILDNIFVRRITSRHKSTNASVSWVTGANFGSSGAGAQDLGSFSFGSADANRVVAVTIYDYYGASGGGCPTAVTIGGVSATKVPGAATPASENQGVSIWYAAVPTGTSGNVVLTWSAGVSRGRVDVYRIITSNPTPVSGAYGTSTTNTNGYWALTSTTLNVPSGGVAIGVFGHVNPGNANGVTWDGGVIEDAESIQIGTYHTVGCGSRSTPGAAKLSAYVPSAADGQQNVAGAAWDA